MSADVEDLPSYREGMARGQSILNSSKSLFMCFITHTFYLQVKLMSGLLVSLLTSSRVKRALQGFSIRPWGRIRGILLQIRIKSQKRVSQNLQVDVFVKNLIFK